MDRALLIASTGCFLLGFVASVGTLGAGWARRHSRGNLLVLALGFALQTGFLAVRGHALGRCPLTNLFEVLAFVSWAMVLFYLMVGNAYRLSPLGVFTAPLAFGLQVFALAALPDRAAGPGRSTGAGAVNPWLEFHAAFSVLAYGAFALAGVVGGLYLWQERQLKSRQPLPLFFSMPAIGDLGRVNGRLLGVGFALLSLGLGAGWVALGVPRSRLHFGWAVATWALYGFLVLARSRRTLAPRRVATLSLAAFTLAMLSLGGITFAEPHPKVGNAPDPAVTAGGGSFPTPP